MAIETHTLTVDLADLSGVDIASAVVSVGLASPALGVAGTPETETIFPLVETQKTNAEGICTFELIPWQSRAYRVTIKAGSGSYSRDVLMPEKDARLSELPDAIASTSTDFAESLDNRLARLAADLTPDELAVIHRKLDFMAAQGGADEVARRAIATEMRVRQAGDDPQAIVVTTLNQLTGALTAQAADDEPLYILFRSREAITHEGTQYNYGDLVHVPPKSDAIERIGNFASADDVDAGDSWLVLPVSSAENLTTSLRQHADRSVNNSAGIVHITADFATDVRSYVADQRYYIAPHHGIEASMVLIYEPSEVAAENKARLDSIPVYAAALTVNPPNVRQHSAFQRKFQSTLSGLVPELATNAGSTGTRFTNSFRILTRLSDGTVVQLHTQGWAFTEDERQTIPWEVSAAEFNQVGATVSTQGVEVWGEFRAVYGGGVDELRGRTNPVFIDFGEEPEWPATRGDLEAFQPKLTQKQQIAMLSLAPVPAVFAFRSAETLRDALRAIRTSVINPEILTGDAWVSGTVQGQPALARTKWERATAGTLNLNLDQATATSVAIGVVGDDHIAVRFTFHDAAVDGGVIENIGVNIPIVDLREPALELQAPINGADRAGVTNIVLPANYAVYERLEISLWEQNGDDIISDYIPTKTIAAQTRDQAFLVGRNASQGNATVLNWDLSERRLTASDNDTIIYAALKG